MLGGRDASQNEELVKKYMGGQDLFVHADVHGASVVIVKGKDRAYGRGGTVCGILFRVHGGAGTSLQMSTAPFPPR